MQVVSNYSNVEFVLPGSGRPPPRPDALSAQGITFAYATEHSQFDVFREVSIEIPRGTTMGLFGPNGTGKTTLMRSLGGLQPVMGNIRTPRRSSAKPPIIGYVPQAYARSFYPRASLETNILMSLPDPFGSAARNRAAIRDAQDTLGLNVNLRRRPSQCSGGTIQQAALIRALARRPDVLIADEPFSALDFEVAARVRSGFCRAVTEQGICAVLALHDLQDIVEVCDLVLAIPGRPYTTHPDLSNHVRAHVFENRLRMAGPARAATCDRDPAESAFISALSHALGGPQR